MVKVNIKERNFIIKTTGKDNQHNSNVFIYKLVSEFVCQKMKYFCYMFHFTTSNDSGKILTSAGPDSC